MSSTPLSDNPIAAVIGAGPAGTAFAKILSDAGCPEVRLWAQDPKVAHDVHETHVNSQFLPGVKLPINVKATANAVAALAGAELVVLAIPSTGAQTVLAPMAELIEQGAIVACLLSDSEPGNDKLPTDASEILKLPTTRMLAITGSPLAGKTDAGETATGETETGHPITVISASLAAAKSVAHLIGKTGRQVKVATNA